MADVPGSPASHAIITPECRRNRADDGAWIEAVRRAEEAYPTNSASRRDAT
jgi:hypothetical protein